MLFEVILQCQVDTVNASVYDAFIWRRRTRTCRGGLTWTWRYWSSRPKEPSTRSQGLQTSRYLNSDRRSFQSDVFPPSFHPFPQVLGVPFPPSFSTPPCAPYFSPPQCGQMPWLQWVICGACQSWGTVLPCAVMS